MRSRYCSITAKRDDAHKHDLYVLATSPATIRRKTVTICSYDLTAFNTDGVLQKPLRARVDMANLLFALCLH
jgi:hypothetical protein